MDVAYASARVLVPDLPYKEVFIMSDSMPDLTNLVKLSKALNDISNEADKVLQAFEGTKNLGEVKKLELLLEELELEVNKIAQSINYGKLIIGNLTL